jgi:hypothetical protein
LTPARDIIAELLADVPAQRTDAAAVARANEDLMDSEITATWFEAGEEVEDLLDPIEASEQRAAKLLQDYLPRRRAYWVRQCARSALALHSGGATDDAPWLHLALIGRELANDVPLERIPLMKQIAETSVTAFEERI